MDTPLPENWKEAVTPDGRNYFYIKYPDGNTKSVWNKNEIPGISNIKKVVEVIVDNDDTEEAYESKVQNFSLALRKAAIKKHGGKAAFTALSWKQRHTLLTAMKNQKETPSKNQNKNQNKISTLTNSTTGSKWGKAKKSLHHAQQSFVSRRITKFAVGMNVSITQQGQHNAKIGYITCVLGTSCMVKMQNPTTGEWEAHDVVFKESELSPRQVDYHAGDHVEVVSGVHQGLFGSVLGLVKSHLLVEFWSNNKQAKIHRKHLHTTMRLPPQQYTEAKAEVQTNATTNGKVVNEKLMVQDADAAYTLASTIQKGETKQNAAVVVPSAPPADDSVPSTKAFKRFTKGDSVEINNQCILESGDRYLNVLGRIGTVQTMGCGSSGQQALIKYASASAGGYSFSLMLKYKYLKKRKVITNAALLRPSSNQGELAAGDRVRVTAELVISTGGSTDTYPWTADGRQGSIVRLNPGQTEATVSFQRALFNGDREMDVQTQYLVQIKDALRDVKAPEGALKKHSRVMLTVPQNDTTNISDFPWENYGAIGRVMMSSSTLTTIQVLKFGKRVELPPYPTRYFIKNSSGMVSFSAGAVPTSNTATPAVLKAYNDRIIVTVVGDNGGNSNGDGSATWAPGDKIEFDGITYDDPSKVPVVDAFYIEEPPVVVIATRVLEERRKTHGTLWDMPSDTWLELAVYVHSMYKKFDKRKGLQTFHPMIRGHIPTTREGRDEIMPPRATRDIMRRYISKDLFLSKKEKRMQVGVNTQSGYGVRMTPRGKLSPEEPANGRYEYQEQQLQHYLMNRYVNNTWVCKHFAPPAPDCGCWGNYDPNTQGWCCWSWKIMLPLCLLLIAAGTAMLTAAGHPSYLAIINLNEQVQQQVDGSKIFCSRLDTAETNSSHPAYDGSEWSTVTIFPCKETSLDQLSFSANCPAGMDCKVLGGLTSDKRIPFPARTEDVRLNVHVGSGLAATATTNVLTTTQSKMIVGAVKVGYELIEKDEAGVDVPLSASNDLAYPPTVFPLNVKASVSYGAGEVPHPQWAFNDAYLSTISEMEHPRYAFFLLG